MRYLSLFSGIEAASVAWAPLGWECVGVAEIEPFPCAVLAHRYPSVPNLGDVTKITGEQIQALGPIDVVVGGSPCQDLSCAGKGNGLAGERSGLFFEQVRIFHAARTLCGARFLLWENVPGAFSTNKSRDFATVVSALAGLDNAIPPPDGWGTEGAALGDHGLLEWSVLDAQWFGLAQRRRRVFAVLDTGDWDNRPPILLEPESLRGDTPPRRAPGKGTSADVARCLKSSGSGVSRAGDPRGQDTVVAIQERACSENPDNGPDGRGWRDDDTAYTIEARHHPQAVAFAHQAGGKQTTLGYNQNKDTCPSLSSGHVPAVHCIPPQGCWWDGGQVSQTLDAVLYKGQTMPEKNRFPAVLQPIPSREVSQALTQNYGKQPDNSNTAHGPTLVLQPVQCATGDVAHSLCADGHDASEDGTGRGQPIVTAYGFQPRIARNGRGDTGNMVNALNAQSGETGKGDAAPCVPVAFTTEQTPKFGDDRAMTLTRLSPTGGGQPQAVMTGMSVRRITPVEAERLQGFPDNWTQVPYRGKTAADGPRYKAIGNSMAVPVMAWIGKQIQKAVTP